MSHHGATLGKYAPLHRGHQLVIETALRECDEVTVVIYDAPSTTTVPLNVRAGWIRTLYPQARVLEGWAGPEEDGEDAQAVQDEYLRRLGLTGVTHFYCSEPYGAATAAALGAEDRRVDQPRGTAPVSGTAIRQDPYAHRHFVDPLVYRDLVTNVVLLGAPGSGKTTLAAALAEAFGTTWMEEHGREFWMRHQQNRRLSPEQLVELARQHLELEDRHILQADRFLFTDTNALTTWRYAQNYHGSALPELSALADACASRYDIVLLCEPDFHYVESWDRSGDGQRQVMHRQIEADLLVRRIPFFRVRGSVDQRVEQVRGLLDGHAPFTPITEIMR